MDTEIGACGFSTHELQTGYSLLQEPDVTQAPFMVPRGTAQTDITARLFSNFRELAGIFNRHKEQILAKQQAYIKYWKELAHAAVNAGSVNDSYVLPRD